jgi:hypothetical protein
MHWHRQGIQHGNFVFQKPGPSMGSCTMLGYCAKMQSHVGNHVGCSQKAFGRRKFDTMPVIIGCKHSGEVRT